MRDHETARAMLPALLAGGLGAEEEERLRAHLEECPACARELEAAERLVRAMRDLPAPALAPAGMERIVTLAQERRAEVLRRRREVPLLIGFAVFSWVLVIAGVPLWRMAGDWVHHLLGWPGTMHMGTALLLAVIAGYLWLPLLLVLRPWRYEITERRTLS